MAGKSSYVPKSGFGRWLDQRLPVARLVHDNFVSYPTPKNLNFWYTFGGILAFVLAVQIVTGVVLSMHYVANAGLAFGSVEGRIMREVPYGWLIRSIHATGASMMFVALYIHMGRSIYYGSYKAPREVIWILGVILFLLMMATAFTGYVLPWGQMSYWAATVITSLVTALDSVVPHLGTALANWLQGGFAVGDATLNRFFSLHYLLPFAILGVVALHIWALHVTGNSNPTGIDVKGPQDTLPFHPWYTAKDAFYLVLFVIVYAALVFFAPDLFSNPDNAVQANPMVTPPEIKPEWYLLPFYAMLRAIPAKLLGVVVLAGAMLTPLFLPWLDTSKVRSCTYRPLMKQLFWILAADCVLLGYVGSQTADASFSIAGIEIGLVWLARLGTLYYFAFFWGLMPWIGKIEATKPLPDSIATPVLTKEDAP